MKPAEKYYLLLTVLLAWFGLALQQYIIINGIPGNGLTTLSAIGRFLLFFTILSNILVALVFTDRLLSPKKARNFPLLAAMTVYIMLVGITYNIILRLLWSPQGWQRVCDDVLHVIIPVLATVYWFVFVPKQHLKWQHPLYWLIFPAVYLAYALIRGSRENYYAYPFIDLGKLTTNRVIFNCVMVMLVILVLGYVLLLVDKRASKRSDQKLTT